MFFDNGELSNDLVGHALGLGVYDAAILFKPWVKRLIKIDKPPSAIG